MDLRQEILKEHSKESTDKIVKYVGSNKERFGELMKLFLGDEYRITQRAGWPLSYCVALYPELIKPYFKQVVALLEKPATHNAVHRNLLRLLQHVSIPKLYHGRVMNTCFAFIESHQAEAAIKAFSLTVLEHMTIDYPDIKPELKLIIEERWPHETPAFHSRARKILKKL